MSQREIALARAKLRNSNFGKFVDKLLITAGVIQHVNDWNTEEVLNKLISGDATLDDVGALRLVPIQKKKAKITAEESGRCSTQNESTSNSENDESSSSESSESSE
eukprot:CAMPEP_0197833160 /NCGR_PEP_ID=MMETSP1437-20131217/18048_1 /TAXON_ID=49252 ORGANISM="Eucampia antarctica, Strain CCMP1452" /NCGR_SAMPLE_ID=MMETSP1437 /ASSEMBLY_ACC=CAM_ASM_001096 /LENGTH=105 /DNA_ID=CAMNT_0043437041 /DNA_START=75 /DNA_END=392 /DNA_ORIENTATION=-